MHPYESLARRDSSAPSEVPYSELPQRFSSIRDPAADPHINGEYLKNNPSWHVEFSPSKAESVYQFIQRNSLSPRTVREVGCGAGEVLRQLQLRMDRGCRFWGYDIAPRAIEMAKSRENDRLRFAMADFGEIETPRCDLLLALEVVDHVEDYFGFLRMLRTRGDWKIFSFSLDISVQAVLRKGALLQTRELERHLHHFTKDTALRALQETGYEIVDYSYPQRCSATTSLQKLAEPIRALSFKFNPDLAARVLGGYSLLILTR
jgi:SAM-dependent methyltransferase